MSSSKKMKKSETVLENTKYSLISPNDLFLDTKNPRFADYYVGEHPTQAEMMRLLWQNMAVDEIVMSISARGYFPHDPLFVTEESGRYVVIEGNRRLCAVKILLSAEDRKRLRITGFDELTAEVESSLEKLPAVITTREEVWQQTGFKHINGPAKWGSFAKAQYIAEVHHTYGVTLESIAEQIGDKNRTVQRLYRAMMVINQAEASGVFHRENRYKGSFAFSHLYTGLSYDGFKKFLELEDEKAETPNPVPEKRLPELGELCVWLYGDKKRDIRPIIQTQNPDLSMLETVLQSEAAVTTLRSGHSLKSARDVSLGDEHLFRTNLQEAKRVLLIASGHLATGYKPEYSDLLRLGRDVANTADDLVDRMERKSNPKRRKRQEDLDDV